MDARPIIAGFLISVGAGALAGCAVDVGQSPGTDAIGQGEGTEEVGQVEEALKTKPKPKHKHKHKSCKNKNHHHGDDDTQASQDCGEDVELCDPCSGGYAQCTSFHPFSQCDVTESGVSCSCQTELSVYSRTCEPDVGES